MSSAGRAGSPASCCGLAENGEPGGPPVESPSDAPAPKSASSGRPAASSSTFDGLRSRCTMRRECACSSAAAMSMSSGRILRVRGAAHLAQVAARGQHHGQHRGIGAAHRLVDAQHAGMIEPRGERELALEHLPGGFGVLELRVEDLERDFGVAHFVTRAPNLAVPAGAEFFDEHEAAAQLGAGLVLVCHVSARR